MELESVWQEYGLDKLEQGMESLFPSTGLSLSTLLKTVMEGDIPGALEYLIRGGLSDLSAQFGGLGNIVVWLVVLGVVSALLSHFVEIFDRHQIADMSFYYVYLLLAAVLLKCFAQAVQTAVGAMENVILFVKLLVPTYLLAVGIANGTTTAGAYSQLLVILIYGVEKVLVGWVLPLIYCFVVFSAINSIWTEEKLALLIDLVKKVIGWLLKAALGIVTGVSAFQTLITPMVDSVKQTALQKTIAVIPGIGNAADGVVELVTGSAMVIKNSIGVVLLLLLLAMCAVPLIKIFLTALLFKVAAALMGVVSDKRITACADSMGDAAMLLFQTAGTAMLLFFIVLAVVATASGGI